MALPRPGPTGPPFTYYEIESRSRNFSLPARGAKKAFFNLPGRSDAARE